MEFTFSQLKQKDVISLNDGKNLGKVCDITVSYPEGNFLGITVTGCKGFRFSRQEMFIPVSQIAKIGEDAVLVKLGNPEKPSRPCPPNPCPPKPPKPGPHDRRSFEDYE